MGLGDCEILLVGFPASSPASFFSLPLNTVAKGIMLKHVRSHPSCVPKPQKAPHVTQLKSKVHTMIYKDLHDLHTFAPLPFCHYLLL